MKKSLIVIMLLMISTVLAGIAFSEPVDMPDGARCHLCGMKVDSASEYSAQFVVDGEGLHFCDIGDMLYQYGKETEKPAVLYVKDNLSGKWTDALKAAYVKSKEFDTPMSWGIAAFSDREEAARHGEPMTFDEALASLGGGMMKGKMKGKM